MDTSIDIERIVNPCVYEAKTNNLLMRVSEAIDYFSICHSEMYRLQKDIMFSMEGSAMTAVGKEGLYRGKYALHTSIKMK